MIQIEVVNGNQVVAKIAGLAPRTMSALRFAVAAAVVDLQNYIRAQKLSGQVLHVRRGNLRNAVRAYPPTSDVLPIRGDVAVDRSARYGAYQEFGTRGPYEISPVRAQALRFVLGGETVFAKRVVHPGLKARPFMAPSLREKSDEILKRLRAATAEAMNA